MRHDRFDDLTKALARGVSRRDALKLLGGSAAGGLLALLGVGCPRKWTRATTSWPT